MHIVTKLSLKTSKGKTRKITSREINNGINFSFTWIFLGTKHEIGEGNEMYQFRNLGEAGGM